MEDKKLKIFSVYHKEFALPECDFITPIQVGKYFSGLDLGFLSDDQGDNIASKNKTFSELTALYWIWKNLDHINAGWIGLCHYRRYFTKPEIRIKKKFYGTKIKIDRSDIYHKAFSEQYLSEISSAEMQDILLNELKMGKIVVPKAAKLAIELTYPSTIKMHYIYYHIREDWNLMRDAVVKLYPEAEASFDTLFENEQEMHCYNMFVASKQIFNQYCSWLFPILFELEKVVKLSEYEYQRRIFGFFSERLFNLFVYHYQIEKAELPVLHFA